MDKLEQAIRIAVEAHREQKDKNGRPYILHPLRVMLRMSGETDMIVAVLHDVVEDADDWTIPRLREEGFSAEVVAAVDCLTRREGESYQAFIERAACNPLATKVKLADLEDNMDVRRLEKIGDKEAERLARYLQAWRKLQNREIGGGGRDYHG